MKNKTIPEFRGLTVTWLLVLAAFVVLGFAEYRIRNASDPTRFRIDFPYPEETSLSTELCQEGPAREFVVSAFVEAAKEPYFEVAIPVGTNVCMTVDTPMPEKLPDERPARIRVRAEDPDGRTLEIFRML